MKIYDNLRRNEPLQLLFQSSNNSTLSDQNPGCSQSRDPYTANKTEFIQNNQKNVKQFHSNLFQIISAKTKMKNENDSNSLLVTSNQYKLFTEKTSPIVNKNHSNCKLNNIAASLAMINNRHSLRNCSMPTVLVSKINLNNNRIMNENEVINDRYFVKDHTFKLAPHQKFIISSDAFTTNKENLLHKNINDKQNNKLFNTKNNLQKNNKSNTINHDKIIDTMDLDDFIRQDSFEKINEDNNSPLLQMSQNSSRMVFKSIEVSNKIKEKSKIQHAILNFTNLPMRNKIGFKKEKNERTKVNCNTSANEICKMLNNLIKDLDVGKDNLLTRSKEILKSETTSKIEEESLPSESEPKEIDENLRSQSVSYEKSVKVNSGSVSSFKQSISSHNVREESSGRIISRAETYVNSPKTNENLTASLDNFKLFIRTFIVNQFDDLIKSHLSIEDRRIKAISKKVDCTVEILGPFSAVTSRGPLNTNWKIIYHCYLISDKKEKCNICLKCLQDSFPFTRLKETSSKMPIDKKFLSKQYNKT